MLTCLYCVIWLTEHILKFEFYQKDILAISESGSRDWWKNMKKIMGLNGNSNSDLEELAKKTTDGDCAELANKNYSE